MRFLDKSRDVTVASRSLMFRFSLILSVSIALLGTEIFFVSRSSGESEEPRPLDLSSVDRQELIDRIKHYVLVNRLRVSKSDVTQDDSQRQFSAQHSVTTLMQHCFE